MVDQDGATMGNLGFTAVIAGVTLFTIYKILFPGDSRSKYKKFKPQTRDQLSDYNGVKRTIQPDGCQEIRKAKSGFASGKSLTVPDLLREAVRRHGDKLAIDHQQTLPDGTIQHRTWTWKQYDTDVRRVARALISIGMQPHDVVNVIGFNAPEWIFADVGAMIAGCLPAGVYTTNKAGACAYIAQHSKAKVLFVENWKHLSKYEEVQSEVPTLQYAVLWADETKGKDRIGNMKVMTWDDFLKLGDDVAMNKLENRMDSIKPGHSCALIYTSGTTGNPKAVMCSHDSFIFDALSIYRTSVTAGYGMEKVQQRMVSYLPLNHAAAKIADIIMPLSFTATNNKWGSVFVARPDALKGTLVETMGRCKPTLFFGVPRVWEKMHEKMLAAGKKTPWPLSALSAYGKKLGARWYRGIHADGTGEIPFFWPLINGTIFHLVRKKLGLDQCLMMATGAAPMQEVTFNYFGSIGIPIINIYGMSECCGAATANLHNNYGPKGAAGAPMDGIEIKIVHEPSRDKEGHGEILIGGRCNMMGYMYNAEKTDGTIDADGYIHSGDVGTMVNGCLMITGRIKELIIGAGGENIAPVPIEHYIKAIRPGISNLIMVGDKRKYNVCLVSLKCFVDPETMKPTNRLIGAAKDVSPNSSTVEEAIVDPKWKEYIESGIKDFNGNEEVCTSRACKIQYFRILPEDLSVPQDTLGPTLKVKRPIVHKLYAELINEMY